MKKKVLLIDDENSLRRRLTVGLRAKRLPGSTLPRRHEGASAMETVSSYVLMEIEKEKLDTIYPAPYFNEQGARCDCTRGKYDSIMLMKGSSFSQIERLSAIDSNRSTAY